jgi:hypothetical protein
LGWLRAASSCGSPPAGRAQGRRLLGRPGGSRGKVSGTGEFAPGAGLLTFQPVPKNAEHVQVTTRPTLSSGRDAKCRAARGASFELFEELPGFGFGPGAGAVVAAAVDVAGGVAAVEGAPADGIARVAALVARAGVHLAGGW